MINIVLYKPEIPLNTGSIIRTAMASSSNLHIIGPLTYSLDEKNLKRAGLDYINKARLFYYDSISDFFSKNKIKEKDLNIITRYGTKSYSKIRKSKNNYIIFGQESKGLPSGLLKRNINKCYRIPMDKDARSLNLSNSVSIVVYDLLRKENFKGLSKKEVIKGKDYLNNLI